MNKREAFKARAAEHGQTVELYSFSAWPTGDYIDSWSSEPDPDDADYPATRPATVYASAVEVTGFFQPAGERRQDERIRAPWGEEVSVDAVFYVPGDVSVTVRDKVVYGSSTYYVARAAPWYDSSLLVHTEIALTESVPRAT